MDEAAWGALALALTVAGGIYTWLTYQRRGLTPALRAGAITLLPVAAWLTGVLELLTEIGGAVGDWALDLAFSPSMWVGAGLAGVAVVLFVVSGFLADRGVGARAEEPGKPQEPGRQELPAAGRPTEVPVVNQGVDDELAEIEAILRRRGIT
jgi:hypothetical protein